ncbi:hypothetical protein [Bacillus sp. REN10]|uniref:hypothetical protein n=1 Tax=Bacillus sp. REN10 TaxID=2782541 RepID=UPI00193B8E6E|nr:hypothetical protein [Bacillus sp. REN10]
MSEKIKERAGIILSILFFGLVTGILIESYLEEYNLLSATEQEAIVIDKIGEKSLFTPPSYYVRVKLPNGEEVNALNRISKKQIHELEPGDRISGLATSSISFLTIRDMLFGNILYLVAILLFGLFSIGSVFLLISEILPAVERFLEEKTFLGRTTNGMGILIGVTAIFMYFASTFLYNLFHKLIPWMKASTEAKIIDKYSYITYRKHEDSTYQLTLLFEDRNGHEMKVIKEVTENTYGHYVIGDPLPISYRQSNPYDIFVNGTNGADIIDTLFYNETLIYISSIAVTLFVGYALLGKRK